MKKIFIINKLKYLVYGIAMLLSFKSLSSENRDFSPIISYVVSPVANHTVAISLTFDVSSADFELVFPTSYGPVFGAEKGIQNLTLSHDSCALKNKQITKMEKAIVIPNCGKGQVTVNYMLNQINHEIETASSRDQYLPVIQPQYIRWINTMALIVPWMDTSNISVSLELNYDRAQFDVITNLTQLVDKHIYIGNFNDFFTSFIYVTKKSRVIKTLNGNDQIIIDKSLPFTNKNLTIDIQKISKALNNFFSVEPSSQKSIIVTRLNTKANAHSINGVALNQTYWMQISENVTPKEIKLHLLHELIHTWLPGKMGQANIPFPNFQWFTEGFTEYLTQFIALKVGLITQKEFNSEINNAILNLKFSEFANLSQNQFNNLYSNPPIWLNHRDLLYKVPYWKGMLLALHWDEAIRYHNSESNIIDLIKLLLSSGVTEESSLINAMNKFGYAGAKNDIDLFIHNNNGYISTQMKYRACGKTFEDTNTSYDFGFDYLTTTLNNNTVTGIRNNSGAYARGLRNGELINKAIFTHGNRQKPIKIFLNSGKTVEYLPIATAKEAQLKKSAIIPLSKNDECLSIFVRNH